MYNNNYRAYQNSFAEGVFHGSHQACTSTITIMLCYSYSIGHVNNYLHV